MIPVAASSPVAVGTSTNAAHLIAPFTPDALMNGVATLVGALLGAMVAFVLQTAFQRRQEHKADEVAAHRIMFCLLQQTNTILLVQRDYIAAHLNSPVKFVEIPAVQEIDLSRNLLDFSSFGFMLKTRRGRMIMYDLHLAQESYVETLRTLNERSRMHRQELQPKLAAANIGFGREVTLSDLKAAVGPMTYAAMTFVTDQLIEVMKSTFAKQVAVKDSFRAHAIEHFKSNDFTDFDFPETYGLVQLDAQPVSPK